MILILLEAPASETLPSKEPGRRPVDGLGRGIRVEDIAVEVDVYPGHVGVLSGYVLEAARTRFV